jgi:pimeloyl-ACP methyl ester carboxylesterase
MAVSAGVGKRYASVGGLRIAYELVGTGEPAVILIHGGFEDRSYFASQVAHLARRQRVVAIDLRGHGQSDMPHEVSFEGFEIDVLAVLGAGGVENVVLCGHSMAGAVALTVAADHPGLVRGVVMLDAAILFPESQRQETLQNLLPALETDRWLDALRGFFGRTLDPQDPPDVVQRVMSDLGRTRPEIARSFFRSLFGTGFPDRQHRYEDALQHVDCSLMYVHAKAPTDLQRLRQLRPDVMIAQVVGSGHYMMLSVPDQVNAMLDRFLETIELRHPKEQE